MTLLSRWKHHRATTRAIRTYLEANEPPSRLDQECRTAAEWRAASARLQAEVDAAWPEQRRQIYDGLPQQRQAGE